MRDKEQGGRRRKWPYVVVMVTVMFAGFFVAGMWFDDRDVRSTETVVDSYTMVYAGSDSTKDVPALVPLYADDAVFQDVAADRRYEGVGSIKSALDSIFATPKFDLTVERTLIGQDSALVEWTANGTRVDTGRLSQVSGVTVIEVSEGKITREAWYYDPAKAPF